MKGQRVPTIRSRLILLVLACIIPASLMAVALIAHNYRQDRARLAQESMSAARAVMSAIDRELTGMQSSMYALATSPHLDSNDLGAFYAQARDVLKTQKAYNILLVDRNYQQRINTLRPFGSKLPNGADPWLQQVFRSGRPVITHLFIGPVSGKPLLGVATPVLRGPAVTHVLGASIVPERLSELLVEQHLPRGWIGELFDHHGVSLARTHEMERHVARKGAADLVARMAQVPQDYLETKTIDGLPVLVAFTRSAVSDWTMAVAIPSKSLTDRLAQTLGWLIAGTVLLLVGSLALALTIGSRIASSLRELAAPALALGSGEAVTVPRLPLKEADEVGRALTRASNMLMAAQHRANHDGLTGLGNRSLFDAMLVHHVAACRRTGRSLAVLYIDLDGFKHVNDVHGHATGDGLLCMVAKRLKQALRASDVVARLGGDEFAVILARTELGDAQRVAAKLIHALAVPYTAGELTLQLSASIGIAAYPESGSTSEALWQRADEAMYKAKAAGKCSYAVA